MAASDLIEFERTVGSDSRLLYALAISILGDRAEAEDAVQDSMELAWKSWGSLRDPARRSAWLKQICVHRCLRMRRRPTILPLLEHDQPVAADRSFSPTDPDLDRAFRRLSRQQRAVLILHFHHGYSLDETAHLTGCRPGTARSHLARGLDALRKEMVS